MKSPSPEGKTVSASPPMPAIEYAPYRDDILRESDKHAADARNYALFGMPEAAVKSRAKAIALQNTLLPPAPVPSSRSAFRPWHGSHAEAVRREQSAQGQGRS